MRRGKVLRRMTKRETIILRRLQLAVIPTPDIHMRVGMEGIIERDEAEEYYKRL